MNFRYLGTAAAEGLPALFCDCDNCRRARKAGGRNIRGRSQAIIDNRLLLDFPADTASRMLDGRLNLPAIRHCLITHFHEDHLYPTELGMRGNGFAFPSDDTPFILYGTAQSLEPAATDPHLTRVLENGRVKLQEIRPFEPFTADRYTVTALPANHCPGATFYHISDGRVTVLYAHDTGYFFDEVWDWLAKEKPQYSFLSLDCTGGTYTEGYRDGHMRLATVCEVRDRLQSLGCLAPNARLFLNHFSHNGMADYDEMLEPAARCGFEVSYDGCELTIEE